MTTPNYMTFADLSAYVDLRVFDRTDQEIFDGAIASLQANMPDWVPREGNVEVLLMEALALELSEGIVAVNRLPGAVLETLLQLFGVTKDYGAAPEATATIYVASPTGYTIPAGTRVYCDTTDGTGVVSLLVEPPGLVIPNGSTQGEVSLIGDSFTASANGTPDGTPLTLASPVAYIDSVILSDPVTGGRDPETDEQWRDRGVQRLAQLSSTLLTPRQFEAAALEDPNVSRVIAVDNTNPDSGGIGASPGHLNIAVLGDGGAALSSAVKSVVQASLQARAATFLAVHVTDVAIQTITITATVTTKNAVDPSTVSANVKAAIISYVDPMTWAYGTTIWRNELIALIDQVEGVDRVVSVTMTGANGSGDYPLPTASTVPRATGASVTVTIT